MRAWPMKSPDLANCWRAFRVRHMIRSFRVFRATARVARRADFHETTSTHYGSGRWSCEKYRWVLGLNPTAIYRVVRACCLEIIKHYKCHSLTSTLCTIFYSLSLSLSLFLLSKRRWHNGRSTCYLNKLAGFKPSTLYMFILGKSWLVRGG